jgi:gamma-glutamylcyclotransferase (GGCT)/AIG2-like uncharacterized protein YtfP
MIITAEAAYPIVGEIYRIHDAPALFTGLDKYEECSDTFPPPHAYQRQIVDVITATKEKLACWTYIYALDTNPYEEILSGDYIRYTKKE